MAPKFGTSGLRGLVTELTPALVSDYVRAFLRSCQTGNGLYVARDLRPSSPELAKVVIETARSEGLPVTDLGAVPTPALALAAMQAKASAIMVTGSHIPADRNGLKFYVPIGEITKADEASIVSALGGTQGRERAPYLRNETAGSDWVERYLVAFGTNALAGLRVGVWAHSAVSRDLLCTVLHALGAEPVEVGRSITFIPLDTEAVEDGARSEIRAWVAEHALDALVSTDGDGDRPLLADELGELVPGDVLGQITARELKADVVVTPVTSNSGVELGGAFRRVVRTKIGSPFVIAAMLDVAADGTRVVGYEPNGGVLLGFDAHLHGTLPSLMTRDSLLPLVATLAAAKSSGGVAAVMAAEPRRYTSSGRIENVDTGESASLVARLAADRDRLDELLGRLSESVARIDNTDGLRILCKSGRTVHLRPSGNAPELRVYAEAGSRHAALDLERKCRTVVAELLRGSQG